MNLPIYVTATGQVRTGQVSIGSIVLTAGSDAATLVLANGTDNSAPRVTLKAAAGTSTPYTLRGGIVFPAGCYATLSGTGPVATVEVED